VLRTAKGAEARPEKEQLDMDIKHAAGISTNKSGRKITGPSTPPPAAKRVAPAKKEDLAAKPMGALASKTRKGARRSSRATSKAERLVCRYCGSDDLAPSFRKRRDARCRACFKKRYGSTARGKRSNRTLKAKVAKELQRAERVASGPGSFTGPAPLTSG
jgi:hypothetical protein